MSFASKYCQLPIVRNASVPDHRIRFRVPSYRDNRGIISRGKNLEYENSIHSTILQDRIVWWGIKSTLNLSVLKYTHRGNFDSVYIAKNTLFFAIVSAPRIPVKRSFSEYRARCGINELSSVSDSRDSESSGVDCIKVLFPLGSNAISFSLFHCSSAVIVSSGWEIHCLQSINRYSDGEINDSTTHSPRLTHSPCRTWLIFLTEQIVDFLFTRAENLTCQKMLQFFANQWNLLLKRCSAPA